MVLTDQQLRQELTNYGESVPPITQRNREQLRARLEVLRTQTSKRGAVASPSRTRAAASPSRAAGASSPSRKRAAASPTRGVATSSPSRNRSSNTVTSRSSTRSKQTPNLIELSDSDVETSLTSRSTRGGQTAANAQTRSLGLRSHDSPTSLPSSRGTGGSGTMTDDVEQSIARHRRDIKQLLDSARDRNRTDPTGGSTSPRQESSGRHSPSPSAKTRSRRHSSKSDDDEHESKSKHSSKSDHDYGKKSSAIKKIGKPLQSAWNKCTSCLKTFLKTLLVGSALLGILAFFLPNGSLLPQQQDISCSVKNATSCIDMEPVVAAVRKQLQVRTGEVECGFRPKPDLLVLRSEVEKNLNERGLRFTLGNEERWNALITYILTKPEPKIILWNSLNKQTKSLPEVKKLSSNEAIRSLSCRARQDVSKNTWRNLLLAVLGSSGLFALARYLLGKSKSNEDDHEHTFKHYLEKATHLLDEQYEKHVRDPHAQPWVAINHIRDKLIPEEDQEKLKHVWERVKNEISKQKSRFSSELQDVGGVKSDVWRWIKSATSSSTSPKKGKPSSPNKTHIDESDGRTSPEVGLTECLKLRNCFETENAGDDQIDHIVDSIQNRCANVKRIEHIGIHSAFVYLKFSSKEAAAQGYHLLNNWNFQGQEINVKYIRPNRYYEHFPEAQGANGNN